MSKIYYQFEIPDVTRPIPKKMRGACGPTGELIPFVPKLLKSADLV